MNKNLPIFNHLINRYNELSFTHEYIFGFIYKGNVYMTITNSSVIGLVCTLDRASRGQGYSLRFNPTITQKILLLEWSQILCSANYFESLCFESKYNKGEIFEKLVAEYFRQEWKKDNVPFTESGDIEVNGIPYQIKFQKATFCNEKSIAGLE